MPSKLEEFLEVLSRDRRERTDAEMGMYVTWLRRRIPLLKNLETKIVIDIIRNGRHVSAEKGDVIIHQGHQLDSEDDLRFFIVLRGSVSLYLNPFIATGRASRRTSTSLEQALLAVTPTTKSHPKSAASKKTVSSKRSRTNPDIPEDDVISDVESDGSIDLEKENDVIENVAKANEQADVKEYSIPHPTPVSSSRSTIKDRHRTNLGRLVVKYEKGKYFGDEAILDDAGQFNVSVAANDQTDFIVIDHEFFNKHIKDQHEKEEELLSNFIDDHPFFRRLTPQAKLVLQISLRTVHLEPGSYLVEQGEPVNKLIFLSSGSAEVTVVPSKHRYQYPELWPFETCEDLYYNEFDWLRKSRKKVFEEKYKCYGEVSLKALNKNNDALKKKCVCIVDRKEVIGIPEVVMDLNTHAQSVRCVEHCEVYTLALKTFRKVVQRRSPETMNLIRAYVQDRLRFRLRILGEDKVPFFKCIVTKISRELQQQSKHTAAGVMTATNTRLKERETELLRLLAWFKQDKAPLIERANPEIIQYKEDIKEKARDRLSIRQNAHVPGPTFFRSGCMLAMKPTRVPMSLRKLKDPVNGLLFRLRMEGTFIRDETELEELIRNCPVTPLPYNDDIRTQTNTVLEEELRCYKVRRRSRRLINDFSRMLERANAHQISEDRRIMSSVLFADDAVPGPGYVSVPHIQSETGSLWSRLERYERAVTKNTANSLVSRSHHTIQFERKGATPRTLDMKIQDFHVKYGGNPNDVHTLPPLRKYDFDSVPDDLMPLPGGKVFVTKTPCISCKKKVQLKDHLHVRSQMIDERDVRGAR